MADKGTDPKEGCSDWFLVEADCSDIDEDFEKLFDKDTDSDISDLLDDGDLGDSEEGNPQELLCLQEREESDLQLQQLKRKYFSPKALSQLSPQLESITISPQRKSKRRLFEEQDSGLELSLTHEAEDSVAEVEVPGSKDDVPESVSATAETKGSQNNEHYKQLLQCSNARATLLSKFKNAFGVSFTELTRRYKSDKTCCRDWVALVYGLQEEIIEGSKHLLQQHCEYIWLHVLCPISLYLLCFKTGKSRNTVKNLLVSVLNIGEQQLIADPPQIRSVVAALFWYKESMNKNVYTYGDYPEWIANQTLLSHQNVETQQFELCRMIQWAYDNDYIEDSDIAYHYAKLADEDANARAFLAHNSQAKFVRECAQMVRHYKKGEMKGMTISAWIYTRLKTIDGPGHWSEIVKFIRFQQINFIMFLDVFKQFLASVPKRNCLLIYGAPDCGKSLFCMSLIRALKGKVISFVNSRSHFWLSPLTECKLALLDDATEPCWIYIDQFLRNGIDGNLVSVDCKHKNPVQIKFPPLLITSNTNIMNDAKYQYLHSRIKAFEFVNKFPFNEDGTPLFQLTDQSWKSFFQRLWSQLDLSDQEDEGEDGGSQRPFQCTARQVNDNL